MYVLKPLLTLLLLLVPLGAGADVPIAIQTDSCENACESHVFGRPTGLIDHIVVKTGDLAACNQLTGATITNLEGVGDVCVWAPTDVYESPTAGFFIYTIHVTDFWGHSTLQICPVDPVTGLWANDCEPPWWFSKTENHEADLDRSGTVLANDVSRWISLWTGNFGAAVEWLQ